MQIMVWYAPIPVTGMVFVGMGMVWKMLTCSIPVPNPICMLHSHDIPPADQGVWLLVILQYTPKTTLTLMPRPRNADLKALLHHNKLLIKVLILIFYLQWEVHTTQPIKK